MSVKLGNEGGYLLRCEKHPDATALLNCGDCGKAICTTCLTLTGEGARCPDCMAKVVSKMPSATPVSGEVLAAGEEVARQDSAKVAYYATDTATYCARHPKTETALKCGRCGTPVCPKCMQYTPIGLRCIDCAELQGVRKSKPAPPPSPSQIPMDDRPRGRTNLQGLLLEKQFSAPPKLIHYILATLAGFGTALVLGVIWGVLLNAGLSRVGFGFSPSAWSSTISNAIRSSIHLVPEVILGAVIAEAMARAVNNRTGLGLQIIGSLAVMLGVLSSTAVVGARIFNTATGNYPPLNDLLNVTLRTIGQQFSGNGWAIVLFWAVALIFPIIRFKRG